MNNKNIFVGMKESITDVISSLESIKSLMDDLSQNKVKSLFDKSFKNENELYFVMNLLMQEYGEDALIDFQEQFALNAIKVIKDKIFYDDIHYKINRNANYYYLILSTEIAGREFDLIAIDFFLKDIHLLEDSYQKELFIQIENQQNVRLSLNEHLENLENSSKNPLYLCGDNNLKMIDMMVRKKKYAGEIQTLINDALYDINQCEQTIRKLKLDLEEYQSLLNHSDVYRNKLIDRLENYFGFKLRYPNPVNDQVEIKDVSELDLSQLNFRIN